MSVRQGASARIFSTTLIIGLMLAVCATIVLNRNAIRAIWYARKLAQAENPADVASSAAALASLGPVALSPATGLLDNPRPDIRVLATLIVARIGGPAAATTLLQTLSDKDLDVRVSAAVQLGLMQESEKLVAQLSQLANGAPQATAMAAVVALEKQPAPRAAQAIRELAAAHPDAVIRAQAIESLGRRRDTLAMAVLISRLNDTDKVEAELLGDFRDERVLGDVLSRGAALPAASSKPAVRRVSDYAERSLEQLTGKTFIHSPSANPPEAKMRFWQGTRPLDPTSFPADFEMPTSP